MKWKYLQIAYLAALFGYVFTKACVVPFSHDECLSYTIFAEHSGQGNTANNHILNTWSAYLFYLVCGQSELAMRLPNILAFALYLFYTYKLAYRFDKPLLQWLTMVLLTAFPFMLDFFAMMRGYGLSLGFGLGAMYYLFSLSEGTDDRLHLRWMVIYSLLAVLANLAFLTFHVALVITAGITLLQRYKKELFTVQFKKLLLWPILINVIVLIPVVFWVLQLKARGELYFGSDSLFEGTFKSLALAFYYRDSGGLERAQFILAVIIFSLITLTALTGLFRRKKMPELHIVGIFFWLLIFIPVVLHITMGFKYPLDRSALFFYPPIMLLLVHFFITAIENSRFGPLPFKVLSFLPILIWLFQLYNYANLSYFCRWQYDANTKEAVKLIKENTGNDSTTVACTWWMKPSVDFYMKKYEVPAQKATRIDEAKDNKFQFYYLRRPDEDRLWDGKTVVVKEFPLSGTQLFRRNK